ncbi:MAG: nicotinate-nucleotide adenylyltransferase [Actinomycetota bacterium]|nr:nicotinate-nucleotide adenylyltransferase [Actinomycetota bacterium]
MVSIADRPIPERPVPERLIAERLGILGGTFDPVHIGHLVAAVNVRHTLGLDRVLLVVANDPWQKAGRLLTPAADRLAMVEAATAGAEGLEASAIEIERGGPSYTADTLEHLAAENRRRELFLVVGADIAADLATWRRTGDVARLATLVVVNRAGTPPVDVGPPWRVERVTIPAIGVSSSDLRARVAAGRPLAHLTPPAVVDRIRARGLYRGDR